MLSHHVNVDYFFAVADMPRLFDAAEPLAGRLIFCQPAVMLRRQPPELRRATGATPLLSARLRFCCRYFSSLYFAFRYFQ